MNNLAAFSLAFVIGSLTATAQGFGQVGAESTILHLAPASTSCPVGMKAELETNQGTTARINGKPLDGSQPKGIGQQIHITLTNSKSAAIAGIRITVHGFAGKNTTLLPAAATDSPEATRTLDLKMTVDPKKDASIDLWLSGFRAITFIDIDSMTYADGSSWRSSASQTCRFPLNSPMLISSR